MTDVVGYQPGDAWLVSGASAMVMTTGDAVAARQYWALVRRAAPAEEIFGAIEPGSAAGGLALLVWESTTVRVLVRGAAAVRATDPAGGSRTITAAGLLTWREELLAGPIEVEVGVVAGELPAQVPDEADLLPVPAGVVRAGYARRRAVVALPVDGALGPAAHQAELPEADAGPADAERVADAGPPAAEPAADAGPADAEQVPATSSIDATPAAGEPNEITGDDAVTVISMVPVPGRPMPRPAPAGAVEPTSDASVGRPYPEPADVDLAGHPTEGTAVGAPVGALATEARQRTPDVTQAVPLDDDEDAGHLPGTVGDGTADQLSPSAGARGDHDFAADDAAGDDPMPTLMPDPTTIAPALLPGPPTVAPAGGAGPVLGDHDGITELAENLPTDFTPPPLPPPLAAGWVYASVCPQGHANQPHAGNCRVCGQPLPPGDPVVAPQPLLGRLRFSTGELVDLDRRVIIGRAPSVSRVSSSELPRLVTVPSPQQDISRSHVEVRLEDWHLVVADLHSTNGTVLRAPDRPEQLLHPGQEMVVEPGWTVDLGDGVTVAVEAAG